MNVIIKDNSISFFCILNKQIITVNSSHKFFKEIKEMILKGEPEEDIINMINDISYAAPLKKHLSKEKGITIKDNKIFYNGKEINNVLVGKIVSLKNEGYSFKHMIKFLENIMNNPRIESVKALYEFLEYKSLPITDDGCFLAYKAVNNNFTDIYTGKIKNNIGTIVKVSRKEVDPIAENTCSYGLHVGDLEYVRDYMKSDSKCIVVKINPIDVVTVPPDFKKQKMRVCKYEVISELNVVSDELPKNKVVKASKKTKNVTVVKTDIKSSSGSGTKWLQWEDDILKKYKNKLTYSQIGKKLNRSEDGVRKRWKRIKNY